METGGMPRAPGAGRGRKDPPEKPLHYQVCPPPHLSNPRWLLAEKQPSLPGLS